MLYELYQIDVVDARLLCYDLDMKATDKRSISITIIFSLLCLGSVASIGTIWKYLPHNLEIIAPICFLGIATLCFAVVAISGRKSLVKEAGNTIGYLFDFIR